MEGWNLKINTINSAGTFITFIKNEILQYAICSFIRSLEAKKYKSVC